MKRRKFVSSLGLVGLGLYVFPSQVLGVMSRNSMNIPIVFQQHIRHGLYQQFEETSIITPFSVIRNDFFSSGFSSNPNDLISFSINLNGKLIHINLLGDSVSLVHKEEVVSEILKSESKSSLLELDGFVVVIADHGQTLETSKIEYVIPIAKKESNTSEAVCFKNRSIPITLEEKSIIISKK